MAAKENRDWDLYKGNKIKSAVSPERHVQQAWLARTKEHYHCASLHLQKKYIYRIREEDVDVSLSL